MFHEALDYFTGVEDDLYHRARILLFLAHTDMQDGELLAAEQRLLIITEIAATISAPVEHANALVELADIAEAKGDLYLARQRRYSAHALYARVGSPQAAALRAQLDH